MPDFAAVKSAIDKRRNRSYDMHLQGKFEAEQERRERLEQNQLPSQSTTFPVVACGQKRDLQNI